ncbi:unnamed protein product [Arabidopsis lyrata]|nr:unnamed protein product [Arabidopsis lyrata]
MEQEMNKKIIEQELKFAKENMKKSQLEEAMSKESLTVSVGEEEASVGPIRQLPSEKSSSVEARVNAVQALKASLAAKI